MTGGRSKCCGADVRVSGFTTHFYVCIECGSPVFCWKRNERECISCDLKEPSYAEIAARDLEREKRLDSIIAKSDLTFARAKARQQALQDIEHLKLEDAILAGGLKSNASMEEIVVALVQDRKRLQQELFKLLSRKPIDLDEMPAMTLEDFDRSERYRRRSLVRLQEERDPDREDKKGENDKSEKPSRD